MGCPSPTDSQGIQTTSPRGWHSDTVLLLKIDCDFASPARTSSEPRPCCEVLIVGTNDLAVGEQQNIYRHLEGYIAARSSNAEIILTTLPHRHDLDPNHPVHYQTVLVNTYIEELAGRHNLRMLIFDAIGPRYFTRHGQRLSWRGKRLLAGMIVAAMRPATQGPGMTVQPRFQENHRTTAATTANMPTTATARGESATTREQPASVQDVSYADAVKRSPSPDILQIKGCSCKLKIRISFFREPTLQQRTKLTDQNRQIQLICEELKLDILVVTENGFNNENLELCKISNYKLTEAYCRQTSKGGRVVIFLRQNLVFTKFPIKVTTAKDFEVKVKTNRSTLIVIGIYRSPSLYILETSLFCLSKCALTRGRDIHGYETRGRDNYRTARHRTQVFISSKDCQIL
ncbi:hypothetical protein J6590_087946 [Homalodisca vitripennis]|nr:hypothetical protein J6590_086435 [Homalodisca vitripennis]KAG8295103.1 hypothetical protein J6590_087946 [Homalodisca vitripennis]